MSLKYCQGRPRLTESVLGWNRETVELGLAEKRSGLTCHGAQWPTQYTEPIGKAIAKLVEQGHYFGVACDLCEVNRATARGWKSRYSTFSTLIKKAEAKSEKVLLARIATAGEGRKISRQKFGRDEEGNRILLEETLSTEYSWQADAWTLERRHPDRWSRRTMDLIQAIKVFVDAGIAPPEMIEVARFGTREITEKLRVAFQGVANSAS